MRLSSWPGGRCLLGIVVPSKQESVAFLERQARKASSLNHCHSSAARENVLKLREGNFYRQLCLEISRLQWENLNMLRRIRHQGRHFWCLDENWKGVMFLGPGSHRETSLRLPRRPDSCFDGRVLAVQRPRQN